MADQAEVWKFVLQGYLDKALQASPPVSRSGTAFRDGVVYIEPRLASESGHFFKLAKCYLRLFDALDLPCAVFHSLQSNLRERDGWIPYFPVPDHTLAHRSIQNQADLGLVHSYFRAQFGRIFDLLAPRVLVLPSARFTDILPAAQTLARTSHQRKGIGIFGVLESAAVPDCANETLVASTFSHCANELDDSGVSYTIIAESPTIKDFLVTAGFASKTVRVFPFVAASMLETGWTSRDGNTINVGYLGGTREVKNPEIIADLLLSGTLPEKTTWHVQLDLQYVQRTRGEDAVRTLLSIRETGKIRLYDTDLSDLEYENLFRVLDIVLLPYGSRYKNIGSGIFLEAITAEVIPIIPESSTMHTLYRQLEGGAPALSDLSPEAIMDVVVRTVSRFRGLRENAVRVRKNWISHPWGFEAWRRFMMEFLVSASG